MKNKKSAYFFIPIILLVLFAAYYWNFSAGYEAKQEARDQAKREKKEQAIAEENRQRRKAVEDATASEAKRKAEREAKAKREQEYKEEMETARQNLELARNEDEKLKDKYNALLKDIRDVKEQIKRIDEEKTVAAGDLDFLQIETAKVGANVQSLTAVLTQITNADAAWAAAAQAAAPAKK